MMMKNIFIFFCCLIFSIPVNAQIVKLGSFQTDNFGGPSKTVRSGGKLFFSAWDPVHGRELWCTDGSPAGTYMVKDIYAGLDNGLVDYFELTSYDMNGVIYFRGNDGINGTELWRSDGTTVGTYLVKDLYVGSTNNSAIGSYAVVNNILYFTTNGGTTLWRSDGTNAGTIALKSFTVASNLCAYNGNLYFAGDENNSGQELWKSNGTTAGTVLLKDINGAFGASLPCNFHATGNALYFSALTNDGWELWKTTGTNASTVIVKDINPGGANGFMDVYSEAKIVSIGNTVYFRAHNGVDGYQLWKSDGTASGTVMVTNMQPGVDPYSTFPVVNGSVLVNSYASPNFWLYDPTADTSYETGYPSYPYFNSYPKFTFIGDKLCYAAKDSAFGCEMWISDGTAGGTRKIQETHLTDNWSPGIYFQGFNTVFGAIGDTLMFTLARSPYDTEVPLYACEISTLGTPHPPSVIVPLPVSATAAHIIWNHVQDATLYELRYRLTGAASWTTQPVTETYVALNSLQATTDYEYQLRSFCNSVWSQWSEVDTYNTAFSSAGYTLNILGDKATSTTSVRIYWLTSPVIDDMQIRYRPYGTLTWTNAGVSSNGFKNITGLTDSTLYEYEYRPRIGGIWDLWYPTPLYFVTPPAGTSTGWSTETAQPASGRLTVYPNPTSGDVAIEGLATANPDYVIRDAMGRELKTGTAAGNRVNMADLPAGMYFLQIKNGGIYKTGAIIKR
jgi:ELWxxDGT repeat protein